MIDDAILNKVDSIERCLKRIRQEYDATGGDIDSDLSHQDALILNLLRACETSISLAMHVVRARQIGLPQGSRDAFFLLGEAGMIPKELARSMMAMVGFRNIAVQNYQSVDPEILTSIVRDRLTNFEMFSAAMVQAERGEKPS